MHATALFSQNESSAFVVFGGTWSVDNPVADRDEVVGAFETATFQSVVFSGEKIEKWDSALIALLVRLISECSKKGIDYSLTAMPDGGTMMWIGIAVICFILPALLSLLFSEILRKIGWIKPGDLKLDL